jgi:SAM-dependent methyltransferase/tetratricopeptide (TPR) repeat protein
MNRKERRANVKRSARIASRQLAARLPGTAGIEDLLAAAMTHYRNGEFAPAQSLCRAILMRDPKHVRSLVLLGDMAQRGGRNNLAVKLLGQALALDFGEATAHDSIAMAYQSLGLWDEAVRHFSLAMARGLRGVELHVKQLTAVAAALRRIDNAWPRRLRLADLLRSQEASPLTGEALLVALLQSKVVCDFELERLLTAVRRELLHCATESDPYAAEADALRFFCALAQQCFINEYVFALDDVERSQLQQIHDRIVDAFKAGTEVAPLDLIVTSTYLPLHELPLASSLMIRRWPDAIEQLLTQQLREPFEEELDRRAIPALTPIDDAMSLQVQTQYEENPFPRWILNQPVQPTTIMDYLQDKLGVSSLPALTIANGIDILIAGCGTGNHSIDSAQRFPQSRVLAVDISRASLAYARRKTRALGLCNIEYGQADILKLASIERRFDVIEAVGVLHHLSDPAAGWRLLLSLLRPNGLMLVGLYSALARRSVAAARVFVAERGYPATANGIRACRQDLIRHVQVPPFTDFFSTSGCRDLLFNVMEHQFTIPQIKMFLDTNQLTFLGFERLPSEVFEQFRQQFSEAAALRDLASWHLFEQAHPLTFGQMYLFWTQKSGVREWAWKGT